MLILIFHRGRNPQTSKQLWCATVESLATVGFTLQTRRLNAQTQALIITPSDDETLANWIKHARITDWVERGILTDDMLRNMPKDAVVMSKLDWTKQVATFFNPPMSKVTMQEKLRIINRVVLLTLEENRLLSQVTSEPSLTARLAAQPHIHSVFPLHSVSEKLLEQAFKSVNLSNDLIQQIRDQFGEKVAYLFTFQQFVIRWLTWLTPIALACHYFLPPFSLVYAAIVIAWGCGMTADWQVRSEAVTALWGTRNSSDERFAVDPRKFPIETLPSSPTVLDKFAEETSSLQFSSKDVHRPWSRWGTMLFLTLPLFLSGVLLLLLIQTFNMLLDEYITQKSPESWWTMLPAFLGLALTQPLAFFLDKLQPWISRIEFRGIKNRQQRENDQLARRFVLLLLSGLSRFLFTLFIRIPLAHSTVRSATKIDGYGFQWGDSAALAQDLANHAKTFVVVWQVTDLASSVGATFFMRFVNSVKENLGVSWWKIIRTAPVEPTLEVADKDELTRQILQQVQLQPFEAYDEFLSLGGPLVFLLMFSILQPPILALALLTTLLDARIRLYKASKWSQKAVPERIENLGYLQGALRWATIFAAVSNGTIAGITGSDSSLTSILWGNLIAQYLFLILFWVASYLQKSSAVVLEQSRAQWDRLLRGSMLLHVLPELHHETKQQDWDGLRRRKLQVEIPPRPLTDDQWRRKLPRVWDAMD